MKRVLLDENIPRPLKRMLAGFDVSTVHELRWDQFQNGKLLDLAEGKFDVFVTADKSVPFQQHMPARKIAMIVVRPKLNKMEYIKPLVGALISAIENASPGDVVVVQ